MPPFYAEGRLRETQTLLIFPHCRLCRFKFQENDVVVVGELRDTLLVGDPQHLLITENPSYTQ